MTTRVRPQNTAKFAQKDKRRGAISVKLGFGLKAGVLNCDGVVILWKLHAGNGGWKTYSVSLIQCRVSSQELQVCRLSRGRKRRGTEEGSLYIGNDLFLSMIKQCY